MVLCAGENKSETLKNTDDKNLEKEEKTILGKNI
jgi:hypothetical protein